MATKRMIVDSHGYHKIPHTDGLVENKSSYLVKYAFSASQPEHSTANFMTLLPHETFCTTVTVLGESAYAICGIEGNKSELSVTDIDPPIDTTRERELTAAMLHELRYLRTITEETFGTQIHITDINGEHGE